MSCITDVIAKKLQRNKKKSKKDEEYKKESVFSHRTKYGLILSSIFSSKNGELYYLRKLIALCDNINLSSYDPIS